MKMKLRHVEGAPEQIRRADSELEWSQKQKMLLELFRAEAYKPNSLDPKWREFEGEERVKYHNLPGAIQVDTAPKVMKQRFTGPFYPASPFVRSPESMAAAQNYLNNTLLPEIRKLMKEAKDEYTNGFLEREEDEWQRMAPQQGSRLGWDHDLTGFIDEDPDHMMAQVKAASSSVIFLEQLYKRGYRLPFPEYLELDSMKSLGHPTYGNGFMEYLGMMGLFSQGPRKVLAFTTAAASGTPAADFEYGQLCSVIERQQARVTTSLITELLADGMVQVGEATNVYSKQRQAQNSPKLTNLASIILNAGWQEMLAAVLAAGELWPYTFKAKHEDIVNWMLSFFETGVEAADGKKWDLRLFVAALKILSKGLRDFAAKSDWPRWALDHLQATEDLILEMPIMASGCTPTTATIYGAKEKLKKILQSGIGITALLGSLMNLGCKIVMGANVLDSDLSQSNVRRRVELWLDNALQWNEKRRFPLIRVFSDDSIVALRSGLSNFSMDPFGIENEKVRGGDYLKHQLITLPNGSPSVVTLTGTTGSSLVSAEHAGVAKFIQDEFGLPKAGNSSAALANIVSVGSSLLARKRVTRGANPLRRYTFMPVYYALLTDPQLDIAWAKCLTSLEPNPSFSRLSDLVIRLSTGDLSCYNWLRSQVLAAVKSFDPNIKATSMPMTMLLNTLESYKLYLPDFPELNKSITDLALARRRIIRWPTKLLAPGNEKAYQNAIERFEDSVSMWKPVNRVEIGWENSLITDKALRERAGSILGIFDPDFDTSEEYGYFSDAQF
jgi:hypothetical protein